MENNWKRYTEMPKNGDYILVFSVFSGIHIGWYHDGVIKTEWAHGETIEWDDVNQ